MYIKYNNSYWPSVANCNSKDQVLLQDLVTQTKSIQPAQFKLNLLTLYVDNYHINCSMSQSNVTMCVLFCLHLNQIHLYFKGNWTVFSGPGVLSFKLGEQNSTERCFHLVKYKKSSSKQSAEFSAFCKV